MHLQNLHVYLSCWTKTWGQGEWTKARHWKWNRNEGKVVLSWTHSLAVGSARPTVITSNDTIAEQKWKRMGTVICNGVSTMCKRERISRSVKFHRLHDAFHQCQAVMVPIMPSPSHSRWSYWFMSAAQYFLTWNQNITEWDANRRLCIINAGCWCAWDTYVDADTNH